MMSGKAFLSFFREGVPTPFSYGIGVRFSIHRIMPMDKDPFPWNINEG